MDFDPSYPGYLIRFMIDTAILAGVPLAVATVAGLIISFVQAITQIQDQTLSQTIKIISIGVVLLVFGAALIAPLVSSTGDVFVNFVEIVRQ